MAGKFVAYRESDQQLLFDTDLICYGLRKSGYLQFVENWPQKYLRSAQLDPNNGANWTNDPTPKEPIYGISLSSWRSPIVFLVGDGSPCGEMLDSGIKTLLFVGASASTKAYVFDLMTDDGPITGLKCYKENPWELTFNSGQPPLNIIASVQAPGLGRLVSPNYDDRYEAYDGGYNSMIGTNGGTTYFQMKSYVDVPVVAGELAAAITFTRSAGCNGSFSGAGGFEFGCQEGCGGYNGGVRFMFTVAAATTRAIVGSFPYNYWRQIPEIFPHALVIKTAGLPFPFN
ncbi:hypothetical protein EON09_06245 [Pseudomonas soli]|jgi:hypothetical protein|uniref:Uncharacterized protein n=1 Tax=Pseudomonas soli TaxID=1306993 RepID=A0ABU7GR50_9PSED|nr:hypothetical protein [Pseudomonas soli]MDT3716204.1 hypothetical protein [Pseudomonas soli]MDT3732100.1 hypothetical protein [Pseudomonas soli]MEE1881547.1 hypothetical protein [Pseudomonas soli]NBK38129.1 hypothetical protein [Pseudomonas soli]WJO19835.1 hypothetical protein LU688_16225 [Pseudomonas soli]